MHDGGFVPVSDYKRKKTYPQDVYDSVVKPFIDDHTHIHGIGSVFRMPETVRLICEQGYRPSEVCHRESVRDGGVAVPLRNRFGDVLVLVQE